MGHPQLRLQGLAAAPAVLRLTSRVPPPAWGMRCFEVVWAMIEEGSGGSGSLKLLSGANWVPSCEEAEARDQLGPRELERSIETDLCIMPSIYY